MFDQSSQDVILTPLRNFNKETLQELSNEVAHERFRLLLLAACLCEAQDAPVSLYFLNVPLEHQLVSVWCFFEKSDRSRIGLTQAKQVCRSHILDNPFLQNVQRL